MHIQSTGCVAALEAIQHFPGFGDFSCLIIKSAQGGITTGPLRQKVHGALEVLRSLRGLPFQGRDDSQSPEDFSGAGNSRQPLAQRFFGSADVIFAELDESKGEVILVIVRIAFDGFTENFFSPGCVTKMGLDVTEQRQESIVLLARRRNLPRSFERLGIEADRKSVV